MSALLDHPMAAEGRAGGSGSDGRTRTEDLSITECLARLQTTSLGRVAVSVDALPAILPVNYGLVDEGIVFRTGEGSKLSAALAGHVVAFEADHADEDTGIAWSVLVVGRAREVTDPELLRWVADVKIAPWVPEGRHHVVLVPTDQVTGRLVVRGRG